MNNLRLNNISCKYGNYKALNNISFDINKGDIITFLGGMATGKSTLAKVLSYDIKYKGEYLINGVEIVKDNSYIVNRFVSVITNDISIDMNVIDVLFSSLDDKNVSKDKEEEIINDYIKKFNIKNVNKRLNELNYDEYFYILIVASFIKEISYLVLADVLCYLNDDMKKKIFKYIKDTKISLINITSNIDEIVYSNYAYFLYEGNIVMEGDIISCLKEEKLLKRLGFNLPFIIDLSTQLKYYNVLDKIYFDEKEMVDAIWN